MTLFHSRTLSVALLAAALGAGGCQARRSTDPILLEGLPAPPVGWNETATGVPLVPGERISSWIGPDKDWLVAFRTLPEPGNPSASQVATELANRITALAGITVVQAGSHGEGATSVAKVVLDFEPTAAARGRGAPAPSDNPPTIRRIYLGRPVRTGTLWLAMITSPERADLLAPEVERLATSLAQVPTSR